MGNRTTVLKSILADLSNYGDTWVISNVSSKYPGHDLSVYNNSQDIKLAAKHKFLLKYTIFVYLNSNLLCKLGGRRNILLKNMSLSNVNYTQQQRRISGMLLWTICHNISKTPLRRLRFTHSFKSFIHNA